MRISACEKTSGGGSELVSAGGGAITVTEERASASADVSTSVRSGVRVAGTSAYVSSSMGIGVSINVETGASY